MHLITNYSAGEFLRCYMQKDRRTRRCLYMLRIYTIRNTLKKKEKTEWDCNADNFHIYNRFFIQFWNIHVSWGFWFSKYNHD